MLKYSHEYYCITIITQLRCKLHNDCLSKVVAVTQNYVEMNLTLYIQYIYTFYDPQGDRYDCFPRGLMYIYIYYIHLYV